MSDLALRPDERIDKSFARVLTHLRRHAEDLVQLVAGDLEEKVHDTRTLIKRLRAYLWFASPALAPAAASNIKRLLRDASQLLAPQRDATVIQSTLAKAVQKAGDRSSRQAVPWASRSLAGGRNGRQESTARLRRAVRLVLKALQRFQREIPGPESWPDPAKRLNRALHASRHAGKQARREGKGTDIHAWRKKTKRLLYLIELTVPKPRKKDRKIIERIDRLQDKLGACHDCYLTANRLNGDPDRSNAISLPLLRHREKRQRKKALHLGLDLGLA